MKWCDEGKCHLSCEKWQAEEKGESFVSVGSFFQDGVGASCACVHRPDGVVFTPWWILGTDVYSVEPPECSLEAILLHGLLLVANQLREIKEIPSLVEVRAGYWRVILD